MVSTLELWAKRPEVAADPGALEDLGTIVARLWAFRAMSLSVARMVDHGLSPVTEAALIKEMATRFEQDTVELLVRRFERSPQLDSTDVCESLLARALLVSPSWSIRGGTVEILRTVIAKGLARRVTEQQVIDQDLVDMVDRFFGERSGHEVVARAESIELDRGLWEATAELGLPLVGVDEAAGGSGGTTLDAITVQRVAAQHAAPLPLAETYLAGWALASAGIEIPAGPANVCSRRPGLRRACRRSSGNPAAGALGAARGWDRRALEPRRVRPGSWLVPASSVRAEEGRDLAGQPAGDVIVDGPAESAEIDAGTGVGVHVAVPR